MTDVFLSYANEDHEVVQRLVHLFECEDWSCWYDQPNIPLGEDFRPIVTAAIDQATVVLVLWSKASRHSSWVAWEVDRARKTNKLVEFVIEEEPSRDQAREPRSYYERIRSLLTKQRTGEWASPKRTDGLLAIPRHPHFGPIRDEVLRWVAEAGNLIRRSDGWNARLQLVGWGNRPPRRPIIGWEWAKPGTEQSRLVRRERWSQGASVSYGTTIGSTWQFGQEESGVPLGFIAITGTDHRVQLPRLPRSLQRAPFVTPFNVEIRITEGMSGLGYPKGGIDLGASPDQR